MFAVPLNHGAERLVPRPPMSAYGNSTDGSGSFTPIGTDAPAAGSTFHNGPSRSDGA